MTFALSSSGRTRQIFLILLLLQFSSLISTPLVDGEVSLISSPDTGGIAASIATEDETIDTFEVHPKNRWVETISGTTATVHDGLLEISDTGDGDIDYYSITRGLDSLDSEIELRFKLVDSGGVVRIGERLIIKLKDSDDLDVYSKIVFSGNKDGNYYNTFFEYDDDDEVKRTLSLSGSERLYENLWYILKIDFDILKSTQRWRLVFENGTKVFDYTDDEITGSYRCGLWKAITLDLELYASIIELDVYFEILVEYVKAPFKEREWVQFDTPTDPPYLQDSCMGGYSEDNVDDWSKYKLLVPYLDTVGGTFVLTFNESSALGNLDSIDLMFVIEGVDADDGDTHPIIYFNLILGKDDVGQVYVAAIVDGGSWSPFEDVVTWVGNYNSCLAHFVLEVSQDRTKISLNARIFPDARDTENPLSREMVITEDISTWVTDPSNEFIIQIWHDHDYDGDTEAWTVVNSFQITERDRLSGFPQSLHHSSTSEPNNWLAQLFIDMGRFIASAFGFVLGPLIEILDLAIAALGVIMESVGAAIEGLANGIWDALGTSLDFITEAIGIVVENFFTWLWNIASEMANFLMEILDFVFVLAGNIFAGIINFLAGALFFFWEALNLPDILSWAEFGLDYFTSFTTWLIVTMNDIVTFLTDISWLILVGWWVYAIPIQWGKAGFEPLGGLGNFIEAYFNNIIPVEIFGFRIIIPQGIVFTLWLIAILPADFALFTAMSS